jgi:hypothetical protein
MDAIGRNNPLERRGRQLRRPRDHRSTRQVSTQQGAHQQRNPRGPQTQWRPHRQCAPRPPHAAFSIGVKFWLAEGMLAAPRHVWASVFQTSDPANKIPTAAASDSLRIRASITAGRPRGMVNQGTRPRKLGHGGRLIPTTPTRDSSCPRNSGLLPEFRHY